MPGFQSKCYFKKIHVFDKESEKMCIYFEWRINVLEDTSLKGIQMTYSW